MTATTPPAPFGAHEDHRERGGPPDLLPFVVKSNIGDLVAHCLTARPESYPWEESELADGIAAGTEWPLDELWIMEAMAARWVAASKEFLAEIRRRILKDVDVNGAIKLGESGYSSAPARERVLVEGMEDKLLNILEEVDMLRSAVKAKDVGITLARQAFLRWASVVKLPGDDDTQAATEAALLEETFYESVDRPVEKSGVEGRKLSIVSERAPRAPKWIGKLDHGTRRGQ